MVPASLIRDVCIFGRWIFYTRDCHFLTRLRVETTVAYPHYDTAIRRLKFVLTTMNWLQTIAKEESPESTARFRCIGRE